MIFEIDGQTVNAANERQAKRIAKRNNNPRPARAPRTRSTRSTARKQVSPTRAIVSAFGWLVVLSIAAAVLVSAMHGGSTSSLHHLQHVGAEIMRYHARQHRAERFLHNYHEAQRHLARVLGQ